MLKCQKDNFDLHTACKAPTPIKIHNIIHFLLRNVCFVIYMCTLKCFFTFQVGLYGHGRLMDPPSRNAMWRFGFPNPVNYNDNEVYCGGYGGKTIWKIFWQKSENILPTFLVQLVGQIPEYVLQIIFIGTQFETL